MTPASGLGHPGAPLRLAAAFRQDGYIVWVLRASDGTYRYTITSEALRDTVLPSDLLARVTVGPFATEDAARMAGLQALA